MEARRFYSEQNRIVADVDWLQPWDENPRAINEKDYKQLLEDVKGEQFKPLIITEDGIVLGGNMRIRAYKELKIPKVWVSVVSFREDDEGKVVAYVNGKQDHRFASKYDAMVHYSIKDNEMRGFYQEELLAEQLSKVALPLDSYKLNMVDGIDLSKLLQQYSPEPDVVEDEAPEVDDTNVLSKLGEVYQLGRHRLMCGDSTKIEDVEKLMNGQKADMVFTSPPYNANANTGEGDIFNNKGSKKMYQGEYEDNMGSTEYLNLAKSVLENSFRFTNGFIFWNVSYNANSRFEYIKQIEDRVEYLIEQICWKKSSAIPIKGSMRRAWEPVYVFSTSGKTLGTDEVVTNVWEISNTNSQMENHKACFPVGLPAKAIEILKPNTVLDLFGGSGSTLIACEQLNRTCYMMELDPKYCDVIRKRYAKFIGKEEKWETVTSISSSAPTAKTRE